MTPDEARQKFERYVARKGGPAAAAAELGVSFSTLACVCNGARGIGFDFAEQLVAADPRLKLEQLVCVRPTRPTAVPLRNTRRAAPAAAR
jgi:hypothetical protein